MNLEEMQLQMATAMSNPETFAEKKTGFKKDERFFKISRDSDKNGSVLIRFLPSYNVDKTKLETFVTVKVHEVTKYDANGVKRFINTNCGGKDCPICKHGWDGWRVENDAGRRKGKVAKEYLQFTSKDKFISNILIIDDKEKPENNGKVFVLKYGKQLQDVLSKEMQPTKEEIEEKNMIPFNGWDVFKGKNFRLKLKDGKFTSNGFPTWEESFFATETSSLCKDNDEFGVLLDDNICLDEFINADSIPTDEKLNNALDYVLFKKKDDDKDTPKQETQEKELEKAEEMVVPSGSIDESELPDFSKEVPPVVKAEEKPVVKADTEEDFFSQFA